MTTKQELIADDLGRVHDLLSIINETIYDELEEVTATQCNENAQALVVYIESAFKHFDDLQ